MTHPEMNELYELYALGALEPELANEIDSHLADGCEYCGERLREATRAAAAMSGMAEQLEPPKHLRDRLLASVRPRKQSSSWLFAVAGLAAACVLLLVYSLWSRNTVQSLSDRISSLTQERDQLRSAVEVLSRPDTRMVQFGNNNAPHGRVFLSQNGGVVFAGSQLPQITSDKTFQLWLIPAAGAPRSAGIFRPNAGGEFVNVLPGPVDLAGIHAVAVSVEPRQGSTAPTTTPILVVSIG
ncbi:MAG TPA: anti-sigma factor [Bryobacteraceae bacterium]|jgi:anti-sigma-K factor RskA